MSGLTKTYGDVCAVDDLSLSVSRGEIFGIVGTNGAGKTTSVECAQGLRRPDAGVVRVLGFDPIGERAALAGRVGSQLQDSNLPDRLRVGEAIALFADSRSQARRSLVEWQLEDLARRPFAALSGGQRQRLMVALALLNDPEIVFLDELTQGLDPDARRAVWELIEQVRDRGTTVVLVTHFMEEAEQLCDRVAVMVGGRLVDHGTPGQLVDRHGRGVRMRFVGSPDDLAWVERVPGVAECGLIGSEIEATGSPAIVARIGHGLIEANRDPVALRVHQPTLEDALLSLVDEPVSHVRDAS